jgi:FlaA1/EpsC-like NDP-sugar epimerase
MRDLADSVNFIKGKRILITGVCGTVGSVLLAQLLGKNYNPKEVVGIDNNESGLFFLEQEFSEDVRTSLFIADIRDRETLCNIMKGIDIVFHAAAMKHVALCERTPYEAVQTNINGVYNVIYAAQECHVSKVIFTSSDKAVNPTNVMGTSKLMGERLITAANNSNQEGKTSFSSTRFGNILGSSGSVIPIFRQQIAMGGPVTLTDPSMTRFVMSIEKSVRLVIDSVSLSKGGEVLITKMPVIKIRDLAEVMIQELAGFYNYKPSDIDIIEIGTKPGEKLYEELMSDEEIRRAVELDYFYSVLPAFRGIYRNIKYDYKDIVSDKVDNPYNSAVEKPLSKKELLQFLVQNNLLDDSNKFEYQQERRYWPGEGNKL